MQALRIPLPNVKFHRAGRALVIAPALFPRRGRGRFARSGLMRYKSSMHRFGRSHRREGFGARRHPAFALVALLAVFLQAFVVQTHLHAPGSVAFVGHELTGAKASDDSTPHASTSDSNQIVGVLCHVPALAVAAPIPGPAAIAATRPPADAAIVALSLAPQLHTHSWQSRAPPSFL
jgi:hypothetical protein